MTTCAMDSWWVPVSLVTVLWLCQSVRLPCLPAWSELDMKGGIGAEALDSPELPVQGRYGTTRNV
jgi:hypothetical protein